MPAVGSQPLARSIYTFRVAMEGADAPQDICDLMNAIDHANVAEKPRVAINRRFAKLEQARPGLYRRLSIWLKRPEVRQQARTNGAYWAWVEWRRAAIRMHRGAKAHAAFGMDTGGRPRSQGFTLAEDAAIYAVYSLETGQAQNETDAIQGAATLYQARVAETRNALPLAYAIGKTGRTEAVKLSAKKRA